MKIDIEQLWYTKSILSALLLPISWLFRLVSFVRRVILTALNKNAGLAGVYVIVVGNITVGGAGKTPFVSWLAQRCIDKNLKVGIISRGYGRKNNTNLVEVTMDSSVNEAGDEAQMLKHQTHSPVAISSNRTEAANYLLEAYALDVIISDDGLQHYALPRDYEIVVVDGEREFGNGWCLPAGPLREPVSRLEKSDLVVSNGENTAYAFQYKMYFKDAVSLEGNHLKKSVEEFKGTKLHAVAGIGNPKRFFSSLEEAGLDVIPHAFADHHPFNQADLEFGDDLPILMTEKDAVKCKDFIMKNIWYVPISLAANDKLEQHIEKLLEDIS